MWRTQLDFACSSQYSLLNTDFITRTCTSGGALPAKIVSLVCIILCFAKIILLHESFFPIKLVFLSTACYLATQLFDNAGKSLPQSSIKENRDLCVEILPLTTSGSGAREISVAMKALEPANALLPLRQGAFPIVFALFFLF